VGERGYAADMRNLLVSTLAAGVGGTIAMTVSSTAEMRLRGREPSSAPVDALEKALGRPIPERWKSLAGNAAHLTTGVALGLPRAVLGRVLPEPAATLAFVPVASLPDVVIVPAMGVTDPPWEWGATEFAISVWHHVAYAVGASAGVRLAGRR
jgi:hypothetical protein